MANLAKRYIQDASGNFGMITALMAVAIIVPAGGAVDFAGMNTAKGSAQNAADIAVLAGTRTAGTFAQKNATAKNLFEVVRRQVKLTP